MSFLHINTPNVVHEAIEGEVVIVNLEKGLYFSTDGVGAAVWTRIASGLSIDDLRTWFSATFTADDTPITDLDAFLEQIRTLDLVSENDETSDVDDIELAPPPEDYVAPKLEVYSDMEELLLLDPIHDVSDEAGWPTAPA